MARRDAADHERLRQALQKATSTEHKTLVDWKRGKENEETKRLARAVVPVGRKLNDTNTAGAKKRANTSPPKVTAATLLASGVSKKVTEAFGIPPIQLV